MDAARHTNDDVSLARFENVEALSDQKNDAVVHLIDGNRSVFSIDIKTLHMELAQVLFFEYYIVSSSDLLQGSTRDGARIKAGITTSVTYRTPHWHHAKPSLCISLFIFYSDLLCSLPDISAQLHV